jgi:hypothetical protein
VKIAMTKTGSLALLLAIGSFAAAPAAAVPLYRQDGWRVDYTNRDGRPRCSITNEDYRRFLQVYFESGADHLAVQVSSDEWDFPSGQTFASRMQFDEDARWDADAISGRYSDGGSYIDVDIIRRDQMRDWLYQFARSQYLIFSFPETDIRRWVLDLTGTRNAVDSFMQCLDDYTN